MARSRPNAVGTSMSSWASRWVSILVVVTLVAATIVAVPSVREPVLRAAGWALVINDPIRFKRPSAAGGCGYDDDVGG